MKRVLTLGRLLLTWAYIILTPLLGLNYFITNYMWYAYEYYRWDVEPSPLYHFLEDLQLPYGLHLAVVLFSPVLILVLLGLSFFTLKRCISCWKINRKAAYLRIILILVNLFNVYTIGWLTFQALMGV